MTSKWALTAIGLVLLVCIVGSHLMMGDFAKVRDLEVYHGLAKYVEDGVTWTPPTEDESYTFHVANRQLDFSDGLTFGDVIDETNRIVATDAHDLEDTLSFLDYIRLVALEFARGTRFDGKVTVNDTPSANFLNIYFLKSDPLHLTSSFKDCSSIGYDNAIICNAGFFESLLRRVDEYEVIHDVVVLRVEDPGSFRFNIRLPENIAIVKKYVKQCIVVWLLGHEIAHAVLHRDHISGLRDQEVHFAGMRNEVEKEADTYVARVADSLLPTHVQFSLMLGEFIHQEFRRIYLEDNPTDGLDAESEAQHDFFRDRRITLDVSQGSYPLILRALHIKKSLDEDRPELVDCATYGIDNSQIFLLHPLMPGSVYEQLESNIDVVPIAREGIDYSLVLIVMFGLSLLTSTWSILRFRIEK